MEQQKLSGKEWVISQKKEMLKDMKQYLPECCSECKELHDLLCNDSLGGRFWREPALPFFWTKKCCNKPKLPKFDEKTLTYSCEFSK